MFQFVLRIAGREGAARGQDGGRRQHDAGGQRGDEEHRPPRHGRGLEGIRHAADARGGRDRGRATSRPTRRSAATTRAEEQEGLERRMGVEHRSGEPDRADEGRPHAPGVQGRARGRPEERPGAGRRDLPGRPRRHADAGRQRAGGGDQRASDGRQSRRGIEEVAADKGYHAAATLELAEFNSLRTYIPEPKRKHHSRWTDKPADFQRRVYNNRRRVRRDKSKALQRLRSERVERTFAHICETGGMRRSWLRGSRT